MTTEPKVPSDLRKVLVGDSLARWKDLTPLARRDFILWIEQAKQAETRKKRIESIPSRLASGKRRICCFSILPTNLYKAMAVNPKAKAAWSNLDAEEKRAFGSWVESGTDSEDRKLRAAKASALLAKGKRKP